MLSATLPFAIASPVSISVLNFFSSVGTLTPITAQISRCRMPQAVIAFTVARCSLLGFHCGRAIAFPSQTSRAVR